MVFDLEGNILSTTEVSEEIALLQSNDVSITPFAINKILIQSS